MHKSSEVGALDSSLGHIRCHMKVEVQLLSAKGRAVPRSMHRSLRRYTGVFTLREARSTELGRASLVASLHSGTDAPSEPLLPLLHDAMVLHVEGGRLRVRGFEFLEGVQLGQTWDVRVLLC